MKAVFNLDPSQLARALALAKATATRYAGEFSPDVELSGNLCITTDYGYGVRPQRLHLSGTRLTYEGGRTTLKAGIGACYSTLLGVFGYREWQGTYAKYHETPEKVNQVASEEAIWHANQALDEDGYESSQPHIPWHMPEREAIEAGLVPEARLREIVSLRKENYVTVAAQDRLAELFPDEFRPYNPTWWRDATKSSPFDDDEFVEVEE